MSLESKAGRSTPDGDESIRSRLEAVLVSAFPALRKWAHGRLPAFARRRADTEDLVQDAIMDVLRNLDKGYSVHPEALRRYLMTAIQNRIHDEIRRARIGEVRNLATGNDAIDSKQSHEDAAESVHQREFRESVLRLCEDDQRLLVGRLELGLSFEDLAIATGRPTPAAARTAARRAALRLARIIG
ncbi:MAG: sigma-70 family RNA polymerase sigma factor [Thermoanaerobaculia bacterium]